MYIEGCSEDLMHFFFSFYFRYIISCILWSCDRFDIHCTYIPFILMYVFLSLILTHVLFLFFLYTHVSYTCMQSIISVSHKDALMSFV